MSIPSGPPGASSRIEPGSLSVHFPSATDVRVRLCTNTPLAIGARDCNHLWTQIVSLAARYVLRQQHPSIGKKTCNGRIDCEKESKNGNHVGRARGQLLSETVRSEAEHADSLAASETVSHRLFRCKSHAVQHHGR